MKIYIAGPMSGIPEYNYPAFKAAAKELHELGFEVVAPLHDNPDNDWAKWIAKDIRILIDDGIERIYVLPNWLKSRGARLEVFLGLLLGIPVYDAIKFLPISRSFVILQLLRSLE